MELTIAYMAIYTVEALILWQYASDSFLSRYRKFAECLFLAVLYAVLFFISFFDIPTLNTIAFTAINFLFIFSMYQLKWYTALFHAFILSVAMETSELAVYNILSLFLSRAFVETPTLFHLLVYSLLSKFLYFFIVYLLSHIFKGKDTYHFPFSTANFALALIPFLSIIISLGLFNICINLKLSISQSWLISISATLLLLANVFVFAINNYNQKRSREMTELQLSLQKETDFAEQYKLLLKQSESQRILIHDIKNHLQSISLLNEKGDREQVSAYIDRLIHSSDLQDAVHICDHPLLDAILCRYQNQFREDGVAFSADIRSNTVNFLSEYDMTALFCNLLDNAQEAAGRIPDAIVELNVSLRENTPFTVLTMTNSCRTDPFAGGGRLPRSSKPDPLRHGYGVRSIRRVVEKYQGQLQMYYESETSTFHTTLTLRRPSAS